MYLRGERPSLVPYTTLFRSTSANRPSVSRASIASTPFTRSSTGRPLIAPGRTASSGGGVCSFSCSRRLEGRLISRSEEHTSELQTPVHRVCRRLQEKKRK